MEEVSILVREVFKWKSVISGKKENNCRLGRWDISKKAEIDNLALFTKDEYEKHQKCGNVQDLPYSEEVKERFKERSRYAKQLYDKNYTMFI